MKSRIASFAMMVSAIASAAFFAGAARPAAAYELPTLPAGEGPEGWYYLAKRIETGAGPTQGLTSATPLPAIAGADRDAVLLELYLLAFRFGEKNAAREAGREAYRRVAASGGASAAAALGEEWMQYFGPDWNIRRTLYDLYFAAGMFAEADAQIDLIGSTLPQARKSNATEIAWMRAALWRSAGNPAWRADADALLAAPALDRWSAKTVAMLAEDPETPEPKRSLAAMRAASANRDYAAAVAALGTLRETILSPSAPRAWITEAGRAFSGANNGAAAAGAAWFGAMFTGSERNEPNLPLLSGIPQPAENQWVAAFWYARLLAASSRKNDAASIFLELTERPPSAQDSDSALWQWLDIAMAQAGAQEFSDSMQPEPAGANGAAPASDPRRALELGILAEVSARWKNPAFFDDILDGYLRKLLTAKSWNDAVSLAVLVSPRSSPSFRTRIEYLAGRLSETGRAYHADPSSWFRTILARPGAEEYYRSLSAWRLGMEPPFTASLPALPAPPALPGPAAPPAPATMQAAAADSALAVQASTSTSTSTPANSVANNARPVVSDTDFIAEYLEHDLDALASSRALAAIGSGSSATMGALSKQFSAEGLHYAALRLARDALNRGGKNPDQELYRLVYPRAWPELITPLSAKHGIPEALMYGIVRSESVFDPQAVSRSGAVGLAQLMPATAAETAKNMGMPSYSLVNPADNLAIGMTYYAWVFRRFSQKPMRAMFAYNAGPTRMARWETESGELPDDILLESLNLSEPRQYGKNIVQAALAYGKIHYGIPAQAMLEFLVEGKPLPAPAVAATVAPVAAAPDAESPKAELPAAAAAPVIVAPAPVAPEATAPPQPAAP